MSTATPQGTTAIEGVDWHTLDAADTATRLAVDVDQGLDAAEAASRLAEYGPNQLADGAAAEPVGRRSGPVVEPDEHHAGRSSRSRASRSGRSRPASSWRLLVTFNVVMGSSQELKARASVDALAQLQVPHARVRRAGRVEAVESIDLVPGDVVLLEAGDVVPADGRVVIVGDARGAGGRAHRRERAGREGRARRCPPGRRRARRPHELVFQNTQVTSGTATFVVTDTGQADPDGPHRRHGRRRPSARVHRCSASSTA